MVSRIKVMSGMDISKRRIPQDGHLAVRERGQPRALAPSVTMVNSRGSQRVRC